MTCKTPGCNRRVIPEWNYCPDCADKVVANALRGPGPEWVRRMKTDGLPPKDMTRA